MDKRIRKPKVDHLMDNPSYPNPSIQFLVFSEVNAMFMTTTRRQRHTMLNIGFCSPTTLSYYSEMIKSRNI
jgi:hypothetical protein